MAEPTGDIWTFSRRASEEKLSDKHGNISAVYDVNIHKQPISREADKFK